MAWGEARRKLAAQTTTQSSQRAVRAPWAVGWFSTGRSSRGPRATELACYGYGVLKPHPPTWRGVGEEEPRPTVGSGASPRWPCRQPRQVRSAQCVLRGRSAGSPRGEARAGCAPGTSKEAKSATTPSLQRTTPWAVGWFSTGRSARAPHATELKSFGHGALKPQPPTWRAVGEEEPRPTAWVGARPALAAKTNTPSPQRAVRAPWAVL